MLQPSSMMQDDPNGLARAAAVDVVRRLVPHCRQMLGSELLGVYLIGSVAHAGFSWRYSDLDIALVTVGGLSSQTQDGIRNKAVALSADWAAKLSVFWADRHFRSEERR